MRLRDIDMLLQLVGYNKKDVTISRIIFMSKNFIKTEDKNQPCIKFSC